MADYETIPVEKETKKKIIILCEAYEMGKRAQGALVSKLVNADYARMKALDLLPKVEEPVVVEENVVEAPKRARKSVKAVQEGVA